MKEYNSYNILRDRSDWTQDERDFHPTADAGILVCKSGSPGLRIVNKVFVTLMSHEDKIEAGMATVDKIRQLRPPELQDTLKSARVIGYEKGLEILNLTTEDRAEISELREQGKEDKSWRYGMG